MVENFDAQRLKRGVVTRNELAPSFQHAGVALELRQTDSGGYVRHIALIPRPDDVVFPRAKLRFGKRVFRLAVQREKLEITVNLRVVDSRKAAPHDRAAFAGRKVFNRVEGEGRKVGHAPKRFFMIRRAKRVRGVLANGDAAQRFLIFAVGLKEPALVGDRLKDTVVIAGNAAQIDGNNSFRSLRYRRFHCVVIHFERIFLTVD